MHQIRRAIKSFCILSLVFGALAIFVAWEWLILAVMFLGFCIGVEFGSRVIKKKVKEALADIDSDNSASAKAAIARVFEEDEVCEKESEAV